VLTLHTVWSIGVPILLVEEMTGERRARPWLGRAGLTVFILLVALGAWGSAMSTSDMYRFRATPRELVAVAAVEVVVVVAAFLLPRRRPAAVHREAPSPWWVFVVAFVTAGLSSAWSACCPRR
jgi:cytochrome bd-type quinol oxidase subunit 2